MKDRCGKRDAEPLEGSEVASSTECTGLLSALPPDDRDAAQALALGGVRPPKRPRRKKASK